MWCVERSCLCYGKILSAAFVSQSAAVPRNVLHKTVCSSMQRVDKGITVRVVHFLLWKITCG